MSTISAVSPAVSARPADEGGAPVASRVPQKTLRQDDFMKLLAVQFQMQDPMKPMEDTAFIAQMAQFSALEQSSAMARSITEMRTDQNRAIANSYLGRRVTVDANGGRTVTGDVSRIEMIAGSPQLIVADEPYPLSAVLIVEPSGVSPAPQPARE